MKNENTLFTVLAKNSIYTPLKIYYTAFFKVLSIFYCTVVVFIKKTTLKEFLHYMQVYLLFDMDLMQPEAKPKVETFWYPPKLKINK